MQQEEMERLIWNSIDGQCSEDDKALVQHLLDNDANFTQLYNDIVQLHNSTSSFLPLEAPSLRFTLNVMEQIHHYVPLHKKYINKYVVTSLSTFFIAIITLALSYIIFAGKNAPLFSTFVWQDNTKLIKFLFAANILVGLLLLDKLFKPKMSDTFNAN